MTITIQEAIENAERWAENVAHSSDGWRGNGLVLAREVQRLNQALQWEQNRSGRMGTHHPNCWSWGHQHYECAIRRLELMQAAAEKARTALSAVISTGDRDRVGLQNALAALDGVIPTTP